MKIKTILTILVSSLFLTAQGAVDAKKKNQTSTQPASAQQTSTQQTMSQQATNQDVTSMQTQLTADLQLEARVLQQLRANIKNFDPSKCMILSRNGEVTIQGNVQTLAEAELIEKEAIKVNGVTRINNNLAVNVQNN